MRRSFAGCETNSPVGRSSEGIRISGSPLAIDLLPARLLGTFGPAYHADRTPTCAIMRRAPNARQRGPPERKMFRIVISAAWRRLVLCAVVVAAAAIPVAAQTPSSL